MRIPGVTIVERTQSSDWEHPLPSPPPYTSMLIFPIRAFSHWSLPLLQKSSTQSRGICLNTLSPTPVSCRCCHQEDPSGTEHLCLKNHPFLSPAPMFRAGRCKAGCGLKLLCPAARPSASHLLQPQPFLVQLQKSRNRFLQTQSHRRQGLSPC